MSTHVDVDSKDVVRIILQYLKENNLPSAFSALQSESGITMNTVDNIEVFSSDIKYGRWDSVISHLQNISIPREKLCALYEQIVLELIESREVDLARDILRSTEIMRYLKEENCERYMKLEYLAKLSSFNASDAYESGTSKERKRLELAESISSEISTVPPSRLLSLLGQAMKYQSAAGTLPPCSQFDLFRGDRKAASRDFEEKVPKKLAGSIKFAKESHPETVIFSPEGSSLVTGSVDGFIEVWDCESCKLRTDLDYQAKEELMLHEEAVLCSCFFSSGELLATGSQGGKIKVWKLSSGECIKKFPLAHTGGVTSLAFSKDGSQLLSTSFDSTARIHGLKSGRTIKEFRGHTSYANCGVYSKDNASVITGSSDGTCKVWDAKTTECTFTFRPGFSSGIFKDLTVNTLHILPSNPDLMVVTVKGHYAFLVHATGGQLIRTFSTGNEKGGDFLCATLSPQGKWLYCGAEDGTLYVFDVQGGALDSKLTISGDDSKGGGSKQEVIGVSHHPHRNILVTITDIGQLRVWRP